MNKLSSKTFGYYIFGWFVEMFYLEENGFWHKGQFIPFTTIHKIIIRHRLYGNEYGPSVSYFVTKIYINIKHSINVHSMTLVRKSDQWYVGQFGVEGSTTAYGYIESTLLLKCHCEVVRKNDFWGSLNPIEDVQAISIMLGAGLLLLAVYCLFLFFKPG